MCDENQPAITVWLTHVGFVGFREGVKPREPLYLYEVQRTRNTIAPRIRDKIDEDAIQKLIDTGVTVNIE